ncbi:MAG: helix-hairpin-helix domain-containing protein [Actinomycetaceae bacterium]|nr:helix-hairpin-helix domain-containing protein [Actinomycetaceae bacterium]
MNIPPPRHAPLSLPLNRHIADNTDEDARDDTLALRRASLSRLALASGTGEDVAAFDTPAKRPRLRLEGKALHALALLLAVILAGAWIYLGFDGQQVHEDSSATPVQSQSEPSTSPDSTDGNVESSSADIVVYISGAVAAPGVYTLPAGSRVNNGVEAAGGLSQDAQSALVNLASTLSDGEHIHIPAQGEDVLTPNTAGGAQVPDGSSGKININTASAAQLEELPGIGPALSQTIISWREDNGRFASPEDLLEVSGIGQAKYAKLKDLVSVG